MKWKRAERSTVVLVKLNKLFAKKYCDITQTEVQGTSEKKKYSSPCYITCRGALKSHVFPFKTSEYAVRVCNMDTWQANALSYFKCWWKNALSFSPDPGSSPNSLMVRDLLSCFNFPVFLFTPLLPWVLPLPLLSLFFLPFSLHTSADGPHLRQLSPVVTGATQSPFAEHDVELPAVFH